MKAFCVSVWTLFHKDEKEETKKELGKLKINFTKERTN